MSEMTAPRTAPPPDNGGIAVRRIVPVSDESAFSNLLDTARFEHMQRIANIFSASTMIPEHYRGNLGNCFIALQMSVRLGVDPFMFMQSSYIVHGKPGMEAKLAIALINSSGLFVDALDFEVQGDEPDDAFDPSYRVRAFAVRKSTEKRVNGIWIDWKLVKAEGWFDKAGSKWKTMPEQMFMYRAASFFGRLHCPERLMGMLTAEELSDIGPGRPNFVEANVLADKGSDAIRAAIEAEGTTAAPAVAPTPQTPPSPPLAGAAPKTPEGGGEKASGPSPAAPVSGRPRAKKEATPAPIDHPAPDGDPRTLAQKADEYALIDVAELRKQLNAARVGGAQSKAAVTQAMEEAAVPFLPDATDDQVRAIARQFFILKNGAK